MPEAPEAHRRVPEVSILMPVYNGLPFVREALDDLLCQTFRDLELVVVDDASTDGTSDVLREYAQRDARVRLVENRENRGVAASLNEGLRHCRAEFIARADADDRYEPDRIERQLAYMKEHPDVGLLSSAYHIIGQDGQRLTTIVHPLEDRFIRIRELFVSTFAHPAVMFRADLVRSVGGYDVNCRAEDSELWYRMMQQTRGANLREPLLRYRKHGSSVMDNWDAEAQESSLSVRIRHLSDYLQRDVQQEEARAMVGLYRRMNHLTAEELLSGHRGLREVLGRVRLREDSDVQSYFRREVAKTLLFFALRRKSSAPWLSTRLMAASLRWSPGVLIGKAARKIRPASPVVVA